MKKGLLLILLTLCVSCTKKLDFTKVKVGMTTKELTDLVGEPKQKQEIPIIGSYWTYDTHLVVVQSDTVNEFLTLEDYKKRIEDVNKGFEDLTKNVK